MNARKLDSILKAVRAEPPPNPPEDFAAQVMREVCRKTKPEALSFYDELGRLFPGLVSAALVVIVLCAAGDFVADALDSPGLAESTNQICDQWLLPGNGI